MSVKVMSKVWETSPEKGNRLLALLGIADNANDDGWAYPSHETLARKCRVKRRAIQKILDGLEYDGEVTIYNRTSDGAPMQHFSNVYHLPKYGSPDAQPPVELRGTLRIRMSSEQPGTRVVSGETLPSEQPDTRVVSDGTHESSLEPSHQPSLKTFAPTGAPHSQDSPPQNTSTPDAVEDEVPTTQWVSAAGEADLIILPDDWDGRDEWAQPELYPCTPAQVNELIAMWWEWVPQRPVKRGRIIEAKTHFTNKVNREFAESLVQRGVVPADVARFLGEVRYDPESRWHYLREKEMTFCYVGEILEEWVAQEREDNWYTPQCPRITPRKPDLTIHLGEITEGDNLLDRLLNNPDVIADVPPAYFSPHAAAQTVVEDATFSADDATLLNELAEMGITI